MKKGLFTLLTLLSFASAFAQRTIDIKAVFATPNGVTINKTDSFPANYYFINNGPDPAYPTDTFFFGDFESVYVQNGNSVDKSNLFAWTMTDTTFIHDTLATDLGWNSVYARIQTLIDTSTLNFITNTDQPFPAGSYYVFCDFIGFGHNVGGQFVQDEDIVDPNDTNDISIGLLTIGSGTKILGVSKANIQAIKVYPNPAKGELSFNFNFDQATSKSIVSISDIAGHTVYSENLGKNTTGVKKITVNTASLASGTYMLHFETDQNIAISKFTIRE